MAEKRDGAEALLAGIADEMAALVRAHFDALKETPVAADPVAVEKMMKVITAVGRATLTVGAVKAAEDKVAEEKAGRVRQLEQMDMNDITPDELERRAAELRARADRILALIETKCGGTGVLVGQPAGELRDLGREPPLRAA